MEASSVVLLVVMVVVPVLRLWFVCVAWRCFFYSKRYWVHKRSVAKFSRVHYSTSDTLPMGAAPVRLQATPSS